MVGRRRVSEGELDDSSLHPARIKLKLRLPFVEYLENGKSINNLPIQLTVYEQLWNLIFLFYHYSIIADNFTLLSRRASVFNIFILKLSFIKRLPYPHHIQNSYSSIGIISTLQSLKT